MNPTKIFRTTAIASILLLALAANTLAQSTPGAVTTDPPRDKDFPAIMEAPDIISHNTRLNSVFYLASGAGPHPVVLLLHGFPGNEQNMDLVYAIRRAGWNVFVPHYHGSWGSAGNFSFSNAIEETQSAIAFLRDPANAKKYRTDPTKIAIVGHSMGGFLGLYATAHDTAILGMAAISAWNLGPAAARPDSEARTKSYHDASPRLAGTTPEGMLNEAKRIQRASAPLRAAPTPKKSSSNSSTRKTGAPGPTPPLAAAAATAAPNTPSPSSGSSSWRAPIPECRAGLHPAP